VPQPTRGFTLKEDRHLHGLSVSTLLVTVALLILMTWWAIRILEIDFVSDWPITVGVGIVMLTMLGGLAVPALREHRVGQFEPGEVTFSRYPFRLTEPLTARFQVRPKRARVAQSATAQLELWEWILVPKRKTMKVYEVRVRELPLVEAHVEMGPVEMGLPGEARGSCELSLPADVPGSWALPDRGIEWRLTLRVTFDRGPAWDYSFPVIVAAEVVEAGDV